jgi:predicted polyphosphate/ATP-dependent NAD kinase
VATGPIGIIVNPASGKDIRRLVAHASVFDNQEKRSIVHRAVLGALATGASEFLFMPDAYRIVEEVVENVGPGPSFDPVETPFTGSAIDTTRAAQRMREAGCAVVLTLGGDGTNRAFAKGWLDAPLVPLSTGTNNVFPRMMEGTIAGAAAGLVATGQVAIEEVSAASKRVRVELDGGKTDLALIDAALLSERFVAARAVWSPGVIQTIVLARAEPAAVGLSSVGGLLHPVSAWDEGGLAIEVGAGSNQQVLAPIAPGLFSTVGIRSVRRLAEGEPVEVTGPGVLAFDGEREVVLHEGERARLAVVRDGPRVIDVQQAMRAAACTGAYLVHGLAGGGNGS